MTPTTQIAATNLRAMIDQAAKAPSSHNTQPWFFELEPAGIALYADRTRSLAMNDPFDRELTISCGAALFNLELAAKAQGHRPVVHLFPDDNDRDLLARISLGPRSQASSSGGPSAGGVDQGGANQGDADQGGADEDGANQDGANQGDTSEAALMRAIDERHSSRKPFDSAEVPAGFVDALRRVAGEHDVAVHFDVDRDALADLVAQGDQSQFADPHWRRELASWMHPRRKGDGLVVPEIVGLATKVVVSACNIGSPTAKTDHALVETAPVLMVLSTADDSEASWIEAGRALEHLLLLATTFGLSAGYQNQPCQVSALRSQLQQLLPHPCFPQLVLRFGSAAPPSQPSPRRSLDEIILKPSRVL